MQKLDTKRIAQLANHIASNQTETHDEAVKVVANHIKNFWNSSMVNLLLDCDDSDLHPYCISAKKILTKS